MTAPITILKFGSSVLTDRSRLPAAVHDIYRCYRRGQAVVVVVSAIGHHTDLLLDEAHHLGKPAQPEPALAKLLSTGEDQAAALLTLATHRAGIPCRLIEPAEIQLTLQGDRLDGDPYSVRRDLLQMALAKTPVLILPGFSGRHETGGVALLGRGGSDLTAAFLVDQLNAGECRLVKDVDGIYECDPADVPDDGSEQQPKRYAEITYNDALRVAGGLVQPKAVEYLQCTGRQATVTALLHDSGTQVGTPDSRLSDGAPCTVIKVALLGLDSVGQGVYTHLSALPQLFELVAVAAPDLAGHDELELPKDVRCRTADRLLEREFDVLLDVSGDGCAAKAAIERCLLAGRAAVTADTQLVSRYGENLVALARRHGTAFRCSAAVGGATPMLETLDRALRLGRIEVLRGVLDGTSNVVLDQLAAGRLLRDAAASVQSQETPKPDVSRHLSGEYSRDRLCILARRAFGVDSEAQSITLTGLNDITREQVRCATARQQVIRLVARFEAGQVATIRPEWLSTDDYLAGAEGHENRLVVRGVDGAEWCVAGRDAGGWPTAEAVLADLVDLHPVALNSAVCRRTPRSAVLPFNGRLPPMLV